MRNTSFFILALVSMVTLLFLGCAKPKQPPLPVGNLKLGIAQFTQPLTAGDMFAGYISDDAPRVEEKNLTVLDAIFVETLREQSKNTFVPAEQAMQCEKTVANTGNSPRAALRKWSAVGRCMGVDILVVPQVYEWRARQGSGAGVVKPARIVLGFFVVDTKNESLISRSHFEETQEALSSNLLNAGTFFKRGGQWVTAEELSKEAMVKAIKELGL